MLHIPKEMFFSMFGVNEDAFVRDLGLKKDIYLCFKGRMTHGDMRT